MFVFLTFGPRVARESSRVIEARPTLCIANPHIFTVKARSQVRAHHGQVTAAAAVFCHRHMLCTHARAELVKHFLLSHGVPT